MGILLYRKIINLKQNLILMFFIYQFSGKIFPLTTYQWQTDNTWSQTLPTRRYVVCISILANRFHRALLLITPECYNKSDTVPSDVPTMLGHGHEISGEGNLDEEVWKNYITRCTIFPNFLFSCRSSKLEVWLKYTSI